MKKVAKLMCVAAPWSEGATAKSGHNKFYNMTDNGDGTFTAHNGRVGSTGQKRNYPMSKWDRIYRDKTTPKYDRNGKLRKSFYTDITPRNKSVSVGFDSVRDSSVRRLVERLFGYSNQSYKETYLVSAADITPEQVESALETLNQASDYVASQSWNTVNDGLIEVYTQFPRAMGNVTDWLVDKDTGSGSTDIFERELENLNNIASQVQIQTVGKEQESVDLLSEFGMELELISPDELPVDLGDVKAAFRVRNTLTQTPYDNLEMGNFLWGIHGTKNHSLWPVLQTGLQVKFAYSGGNWGKGIYFADNHNKSRQYLRGSRFLLIYQVKLGRQKDYGRQHAYSLRPSKVHTEGWDSVKGLTSYNEHIIYTDWQCSIAYLAEI